MEIQTILTPAEIASLPARDLRATVCVVFDVLRATSTVVAALAHGARRVIPALSAEEAFAWREDRFPGALLGGERGGVKIAGFDLGNSPREYRSERVRGRDIVTTTTNGTVALRACAQAETTLAAALVNLDATAAWLAERVPAPATLLLVCAGTGPAFALEDGLAAGALAVRLGGPGAHVSDDATRALGALYEQHRHDLPAALRASENGRRLTEIGLGEDVAWCARESVLAEVAILQNGALQAAQNLLFSDENATNSNLPPIPKIA